MSSGPASALEVSYIDAGAEVDAGGWPGFGTDAFEMTPTASSLLSQMSLPMDDPEGPLLDALARLQAERARSERLESALDVSRALGGLSHSGRPDAAAIRVQSILRGHCARLAATALRARHRELSACLLQSRARAMLGRRARLNAHAIRIQRRYHHYSVTVLHKQTKSSLRRQWLSTREAAQRAAAEHTAALAKKDEALERLIERQLQGLGGARHARAAALAATSEAAAAPSTDLAEGATAAPDELVATSTATAPANSSIAVARVQQRQEAMTPEQLAVLPRARPITASHVPAAPISPLSPPMALLPQVPAAASIERCGGRCGLPSPPQSPRGLVPSATATARAVPMAMPMAMPMAAAVPVPVCVSMERDAAARLRDAEALIRRLEAEKAELASQLHEQLEGSCQMAEVVAILRAAKQQAEDTASHLLARQLTEEEEKD